MPKMIRFIVFANYLKKFIPNFAGKSRLVQPIVVKILKRLKDCIELKITMSETEVSQIKSFRDTNIVKNIKIPMVITSTATSSFQKKFFDVGSLEVLMTINTY